MGTKQLAAVGFRLFAVWILIGALQVFGMTESIKRAAALWGDSSLLGLSITGALVGLAIIVWALSGWAARILFSGLPANDDLTPAPLNLVVVGCLLMGLWWFKEAVVPFIGLWLKAMAISSETGQSAFVSLGSVGKVNLILYLVQIAIAVVFVTRPYWLAGHLLRISQQQGGERAQ